MPRTEQGQQGSEDPKTPKLSRRQAAKQLPYGLRIPDQQGSRGGFLLASTAATGRTVVSSGQAVLARGPIQRLRSSSAEAIMQRPNITIQSAPGTPEKASGRSPSILPGIQDLLSACDYISEERPLSAKASIALPSPVPSSIYQRNLILSRRSSPCKSPYPIPIVPQPPRNHSPNPRQSFAHRRKSHRRSVSWHQTGKAFVFNDPIVHPPTGKVIMPSYKLLSEHSPSPDLVTTTTKHLIPRKSLSPEPEHHVQLPAT